MRECGEPMPEKTTGSSWNSLQGEFEPRSPRSAERDGEGEASLAGLLVLAVHVFGGLAQSRRRCVEIDAVPGRDFVAGDRVGGPRLDSPECAPLDARHLDVTGDRVARHAE